METGDGIITFADLGITPPETTKDTFLGKVRSFKSLNAMEIAFLVISGLSILGVAGVTIQRLTTIDKTTADFTVAIVIIINTCFSVIYVVHGVFFERPYELAVFVMSSGLVWFYGMLNYVIADRDSYKLARLITSSVLTPCLVIMGLYLAKTYHSTKNLIFRTVGANPALQSICETMFLFYSLLKADLQVCITTAVLILTSGKDTDTEDKIVLPLVLVIGALTCSLGFFSVRYEVVWAMICYFAMWITMPSYAVYLIVKSAQDLVTTSDNTPGSKGINAVSFVAAVALLTVRVIALISAVRVFRNFGKGLKDRFYDDAMEKNFKPDSVKAQPSEDIPHSPADSPS